MSIRKHPAAPHLWQARYRNANGQLTSKTFRSKTEAQQHDEAQRVDRRRGDQLDADAAKRRLSTYADDWMTIRDGSDLKPSTVERDRFYVQAIRAEFGDRRVGAIKPTQIERWMSSLTASSATKAKLLQKLRSILDLARRDGAFKANPAADVKTPKIVAARVGRALADDEVRAVIDAAEAVDSDQALVVWFMARCGMRIGEALAIRRDDVDFTAGTIRIERTLTKDGTASAVKGRQRADEGRTIPMSDDVAERVKVHIGSQVVAPLDGLLITTSLGKPIRYDNWRRRVWLRIVDMADVGDVHPHDLRHTCATRLFVEDRWTPGEVQAFLGHRDPRITLLIYTHIDAESLPKPMSMWTNSGQIAPHVGV